MGQSADQIRREIEATRNELGQTIDAIGDRVSPRQAVRRRTSRLRHGLTTVRETVMGKAEDASDAVGSATSSVSDRMSSVSSTVKDSASATAHEVAVGVESAAETVAGAARQAPQAVARQTRGNPLAAGIVAFGAGLLVASVLPATDKERRLASTLSDELAPLQSAAREAGEQLKGSLTSTAQEAADRVRDRARDATEELATEAQSAVDHVKEQATGAGSEADKARDAAQRASTGGSARPVGGSA